MRTIFHITHKSDWEKAKESGRYEADTLKTQSFIHMSRPHQVLKVGDFLFKRQKDLLLLQVVEERVTSEIKPWWEFISFNKPKADLCCPRSLR